MNFANELEVEESDEAAALGPVCEHPSLDGLPEVVTTKILVEFFATESIYCPILKEGMITLTRLASTSKRWSQIVYNDTPRLWRKIEIYRDFRMTDKQLAALLRKTNAKEVCEDFSVYPHPCISGVGLEPIRGSSILRSFRFTGENPDLKAVTSIVWSFAPFSSDNSGPGLLDVDLPSLSKIFDKKQRDEYAESLRGLQKSFRMNCNSMKGRPFPCNRCDTPKDFWLHSDPHDSFMLIETYCAKCHSYCNDVHDIYVWSDWEIEERESRQRHFLDGCVSCKKAFNFADFKVCASCPDEKATCCSDCLRMGSYMEICSICDTPSCKYCFDEENLCTVHKCLGCGVKACSICRDQYACEGNDCSGPEGRRWYCAECNVLKPCTKCRSKICRRNECSSSCFSCGDVFCHNDGSLDCIGNLKPCNVCRRLFCPKNECSLHVGSGDGRECRECVAASPKAAKRLVV